jgi:signal transduction histidine kinase/ActR/RegA family two-component response regulator
VPPTRDVAAERTLRDVVALSTLPAIWLGAEPVRIVESLAASLYSVLDADLVYVVLHGDAEHEPIAVAQTGRNRADPDAAAMLGPALLAWVRSHDPDDLMPADPCGAGIVHLSVRPLAIDAEYGLIAAGFADVAAFDARRRLLLTVAATQATVAIQNVRLLRSLRRHAARQRTAVREAEAARSEAEAASRAKDEFLAMLGHELRNPLAPIQTALQLMRLRGDTSAERERTVIERQVRHLTRLVDDLLDVSRIAQGKVDLRRERIALADVIGKAIEQASPLIEQRRHSLDVQVPREGLQVDGDPVRLAQIVANLLTNAAKYTEPGGLIEVRTEQSGEQAVLRVRDTGIGIAPEMLPRIFDLFVQEQQGLERAQGGLGLGLTIVRSLVQMHGGTVSAHSEGLGKGSEFVIRLPLTPVGERSAAVPPPSSSRDVARTLRVLVVDDNEDAADMLVDALLSKGYQTRHAHDGPAAIRMCQSFKPHVALLDIGLPVMDGYELAQRLRQLPGMEALQLHAVTGYAQESDRERSRLAGFGRHFVKPLDMELLDSVLRESAPRADGGTTARGDDVRHAGGDTGLP